MKKLIILAAATVAALAVVTNAGALRPPVDTFCSFANGQTQCTTAYNTYLGSDTLCQDGELFQVDNYAEYAEIKVYRGNALDRNGDLKPHAKLIFESTTGLHGSSDVTDLGVPC